MDSQGSTAGNQLRDRGRQGLFVGIGGAIFAYLGANGLQGWGGVIPMVVVAVLAIVVIGGSLMLLNIAGRMPRGPSPYASVGKQYRLITTLEYVGFAVALVVCNLLNQANYLTPLIVLISGLHFVALGSILRTRAAYIKGALLSLIPIVTVIALPAEATLSAHQLLLWWVVAGFAGALVAWIDAFISLARGLRIVRAPSSAVRDAPPLVAG